MLELPDVLVALQNVLNAAGIDDDEIMGRPQFSREGYAKIAKKLARWDVTADMAPNLIDQLAQGLLDSEDIVTEDEDAGGDNYTWEKDAMGTITVRSAKSGNQKSLDIQGSAKLIDALNGTHAPEQDILRRVMNESRELDDLDMGGTSTMNFPWKMDGRNGFGTARFNGHGSTFDVDVFHVTDRDGDPVDFDSDQMERIKAIALAFVQHA